MMQPPSLNHSTSSTPPVPRYRRWAATLAIAVASIGSVATSPPISPAVVSQYEGPPLSLTTRAPTTARYLKVRVTAEDYSFDMAEARVEAQITARWRPTDPNRTEKPWLRTRLYVQSDNSSGYIPHEVLVFDEPGQPVTLVTETRAYDDCKPNQGCEWTLPMEFELQPNAAEGSVEVEWKVMAEANAEGTTRLPKGFTVRISEQ